VPVREAAARFGVSTYQVYKVCREQGLRFGADGQAGVKAAAGKRHRAMAEAAKRGEPAASIARRLRSSETTVRYACAKLGVRPVPGTGSRHARGLELRRALRARLGRLSNHELPATTPRTRRMLRLMLGTDWTMRRIARACGVRVQSVNEVWKRVRRQAR